MAEKKISELVLDSSLLIVAGIAYFAISLLVPQYNDLFNSYKNLPWGVFTSIFLFDNWENVLLFGVIIVIFVLSGYRITRTSMKKRALFMSISMFVISILADTYWVIVFPDKPSYGQSGAMFSLYGSVIVIGASNIIPIISDVRNKVNLRLNQNAMNILWPVFSIVMVCFIIYWSLSNATYFLDISNGVAYQIHEFALAASIPATGVFLFLTGRTDYVL